MRKVDVVNKISETTGVPKTDVLITIESFFKEVKKLLKKWRERVCARLR
jgi:DNA-binding protein HU-beta